jgi:hypothetical protein
MSNMVPSQYRQVSVTKVDFALTPSSLVDFFLGREVYRRTRFIVVRGRGRGRGSAVVETAVVQVGKLSDTALMAPVTSVEVLATPSECAFVCLPDIDTAVPTSLARAARDHAQGARCVVIEGRYHHISFILDPAPLRIRVTEVIPPEPAKLVDQAQRVLDLADDLPPIELVPDVVDLRLLLDDSPFLLPCRGSGLAGSSVSFLDERPPRQEWTMVGCARSRSLHQWFYGDLPAEVIELCPRIRSVPDDMPVLRKCCLLETHNELEDGGVVVPWGASLDLVRQALSDLASVGVGSWSLA